MVSTILSVCISTTYWYTKIEFSMLWKVATGEVNMKPGMTEAAILY